MAAHPAKQPEPEAPPQPPAIEVLTPPVVAVPRAPRQSLRHGYEFSYLALLLLLGLVYNTPLGLQQLIPDPVGGVPIGVAWFGALGAAARCLYGAYFRREVSDSRAHLPHLARIMLGIVLAVVAYLMVTVVIGALGATAGSRDNRPYFLIAVFIGFMEEHLRVPLFRTPTFVVSDRRTGERRAPK